MIKLVGNSANMGNKAEVPCPLRSVGKILSLATLKLGLPMPALRMFTAAGVEVSHSSQLQPGDTVTISCGEAFWKTTAARRRRRHYTAAGFQKGVQQCVINQNKDIVAVTIQKMWRGYQARMRHRPPTTVEAPSPKPLEEAPAPEEAPAFEELPIEIEKRGITEVDLNGPELYSATGLCRFGEYRTASSFVQKLRSQSAPSWWAECITSEEA